jgi:WD40 repeat protein
MRVTWGMAVVAVALSWAGLSVDGVRAVGTALATAQAQAVAPASSRAMPIFHYESQRGALVVRAVDTDGRLTSIDVQGCVGLPVWAPDGSRFAFVLDDSSGTAIVVSSTAGERQPLERLTGAREVFAPPLQWSPDGKSIAALAFGQPPAGVSILVLDAATGAQRGRHSLPATAATLWTEEPITLRWSPDGRRILLASHEAYAIELATGAVDTLARHLILPVWSPASDGVYSLDVEPEERASGAAVELHPRFTGFSFRPLGGLPPIPLAGADLLDSLGLGDWKFTGLEKAPDSGLLAIWSTSLGQSEAELSSTIRIYDLRGPAPLALTRPDRTITLARTFVSSVKWGPLKDTLAAAVGGPAGLEIGLVDLGTGKLKVLRELAPDEALGMAFLHFIPGNVLSWGN